MELEDYRKQLDEIDKKLALLFEKRMEVMEKVRVYKNENHLPVLDKKREDAMHIKNAGIIKNKDFVACHAKFLSSILAISKGYMMEKNLTEKLSKTVQEVDNIEKKKDNSLQKDKKNEDDEKSLFHSA